ncbi:hypothetical protein T11_3138 [Trichinella zimbabwensis]|uniref:Uncharacterized protein n=1 Tax=Trichinella zimbabwensis TaxID=268475 RepID=A0A0V1H244_9BILA|nr:hypothetical protein T11_3138 [Trichinella zimbabwensis]
MDSLHLFLDNLHYHGKCLVTVYTSQRTDAQNKHRHNESSKFYLPSQRLSITINNMTRKKTKRRIVRGGKVSNWPMARNQSNLMKMLTMFVISHPHVIVRIRLLLSSDQQVPLLEFTVPLSLLMIINKKLHPAFR